MISELLYKLGTTSFKLAIAIFFTIFAYATVVCGIEELKQRGVWEAFWYLVGFMVFTGVALYMYAGILLVWGI